MLVPASSGLTVVFGAAIGVLWLSTVPLTSGMVTEQFGTTHSGTLFGIVFLSHQIGAFAGAWMGANSRMPPAPTTPPGGSRPVWA